MGKVRMRIEESRNYRYKARVVKGMLWSIFLSAMVLMGCSRPGIFTLESPSVKIRLVYSSGDLRWKSGMEDLAEAFMKENQDIEIELFPMSEIKNQTYVERLKILAAKEELYDLLELRETETLAEAGLLAPILETVVGLVKEPGIYGGVCYGVPRFTTTLGMIYNKDIFSKLRLSEPKTYEEFLQICERLKRAGYEPLTLGAADIWHMKFWGNYLFQNYMVTENGEVRWNQEQTEKMLKDFRNLARKGYVASRCQFVSDSQTAQDISSQRAGMVYTGPWMLSQIENLNPQIRLGFFFLPGKSGRTYAMRDSNVEWGISAQTAKEQKKLDARKKFLEFYYSEGTYETILEIMNAEAATVRKIHRADTNNQRLIKNAYACRPIETGIFMENAGSPEGFIAYYDQKLIETLWGSERIADLARDLIQQWEMP